MGNTNKLTRLLMCVCVVRAKVYNTMRNSCLKYILFIPHVVTAESCVVPKNRNISKQKKILIILVSKTLVNIITTENTNRPTDISISINIYHHVPNN